jgi:xanthine dehydrogenase accessory factor
MEDRKMTTANKTLDLAQRLRAEGKDYAMATILRTFDSTAAKPGDKAVVLPDGELRGFVGGHCVTGAVKRTGLEVLKSGEPKMIRVRPKDEVTGEYDLDGVELHTSMCLSRGTVEIFVEPVKSARRLVILGASPVAQAILTLAQPLGYRVTVGAGADDHAKIPGAEAYLEGFAVDDLSLAADDSVIVATQGKGDRDALRAALRSGAGYVGMVCSRRKVDGLKSRLLEEAADLAPAFAALHAPAGLDIGAEGPEEIALSVFAEIVAHCRLGAQREAAEIRHMTAA